MAIPELQVGDILDYFITDEFKLSVWEDVPELVFHLAYKVPVLSYSVHCMVSHRMAVEYKTINGAPPFNVSKDASNQINILDMEAKDLLYITDKLWTFPLRETPTIRMKIYNVENRNIAHPGSRPLFNSIEKDKPYSRVIRDTEWSASAETGIWQYNKVNTLPFSNEISKLLKDYKLQHPQASPDEINAFIYYAFRYYMYQSPDEAILVGNKRNFERFNSRMYILFLERFLFYLNRTDALALGMTIGRNESDAEDIFSRYDSDFFLTKASDPSKNLFYYSPFTHAWFVPGEYEGQKVSSIQVEKYAREGSAKGKNPPPFHLPVSDAEKNKETINISAKIVNSDLIIERNPIIMGDRREAFQKMLLLYEDYEGELREFLGIKETFWEEIARTKRLSKLTSDYKADFEKARKEQKENLKLEAFLYHNEKIEDILEYKIINSALTHYDPEFSYQTTYIKNNFLKKAGNNYIVDVGKLIGSPINISPSERENRKMNIYHFSTNTCEYNISI
ncbi:MAG: hypothetical protein LIO93_09045 [Bacteroidales bacterium]|nr:hypothetical protein [Bacteroidales bacterium]